MRLFVAVFPPMEVREALASAAGGLRVSGEVRWVRSENVHLTLKFLGEVPDESTAHISRALGALAGRHEPFGLVPSGFGGFPSGRKARVIWAGTRGDVEALAALAEDLESSLEPLGFEREKRPFSPHLTLGRARRRPVRVEVERDSPETGFPGFRVEEVVLVESETNREGARYTPLETFGLG